MASVDRGTTWSTSRSHKIAMAWLPRSARYSLIDCNRYLSRGFIESFRFFLPGITLIYMHSNQPVAGFLCSCLCSEVLVGPQTAVGIYTWRHRIFLPVHVHQTPGFAPLFASQPSAVFANPSFYFADWRNLFRRFEIPIVGNWYSLILSTKIPVPNRALCLKLVSTRFVAKVPKRKLPWSNIKAMFAVRLLRGKAPLLFVKNPSVVELYRFRGKWKTILLTLETL